MKLIIKTPLFILFCVYLLALTKMILFKYIVLNEFSSHFNFKYSEYYWHTQNFIPFKTIFGYLFLDNRINFNIRFENLAGNVIGFIPFGFMVPLLFKRYVSLIKVIFATFCLSLTYEVIQLLFKFGSFDVDDLILNTLGGCVGFITILLLGKIWTTKKKQISHSG